MALSLQANIESLLHDLVSEVSEIDPALVLLDADFQELGLDSRFVIALNQRLGSYFPGVPRTIFFEYPSIRAVASYLVERFPEQIHKLFSRDGLVAEPVGKHDEAVVPPDGPAPAHPPVDLSELASLVESIPLANEAAAVAPPLSQRSRHSLRQQPARDRDVDDIAIIGVAGRYPKAKNVWEFWRSLREGRDCIEPLPKERWPSPPGRMYWGGYLDGVANFDPLFFGISPREAESIDPQERQFLEVAWETIESAGYDPLHLNGRDPAPVGVFVGVMYSEYQILGAELSVLDRPTTLVSSPAMIANRVSYFMNFEGPSIALDTLCSSSLTAIHLACMSIRAGDCELALAGGTNLTIHPHKYRLLEAGRYLATDGRCRSYGADGSGYVPGEGVGAVLLKPLGAARGDGDTIWAVIRSTSVNHGARGRGYTIPNPNAQASSLAVALERARIDPNTIGYIEGHGTGTALGDPIEIRGIHKALGDLTEKCPIGSVKSNIGHAEAAAGVAGLTKVLLQLRAQELVPSLHSEPPNSNIDFEGSPVRVQRRVEPWKQKVVVSDGVAEEVPRRALVAAFGAGGSNAHIVIEETSGSVPPRAISAEPRLFVLSARSPDRLRAHAQGFLEFLSRAPAHDQVQLRELFYDLCATLCFGRTLFESRLAIVADDLRRLQQKLEAFVYGLDDPYVFADDKAHPPGESPEHEHLIERARQWARKEPIDLGALYRYPWKRLALPTYPFEPRRIWPFPEGKLHDLGAASRSNVPSPKVVPEPPVPIVRQEVEALASHPPEQVSDLDVIQTILGRLLAEVLRIEEHEIGPETAFFEYGLESVTSVEFAERVNSTLAVDITPTVFFEFNSLAAFSTYLLERHRPVVTASGAVARVQIPSPAGPPSKSKDTSLEELWAAAVESERGEAGSATRSARGPAIELRTMSGVDGYTVEFATMGEGPPLVFLSGLLMTHEPTTQHPDFVALAEDYQLIIVHPPGAGRSELPRENLTMEFIVKQVEKVRSALDLSPIMLLGYSFGGLVAQAYASRFGSHVSKLVLACTTPDPSSISNGMHLVARESQRFPDGPRLMQFSNASEYPSYGKLSAQLTAEELAYSPIPTLIVAGEDDQYMPPVHAERLARDNPQATLHVVKGAGHFLGFSHSQWFVSALSRFLSGASEETTSGPDASSRGVLPPMSTESIAVLTEYMGGGEIASAADISPVAGQLGYLLNHLFSGEDIPTDPFHCFFLPSGIEAIDAAIRFGRRYGGLSKHLRDAKTIVVDPDGVVRRHFEFLPRETMFSDLTFVAAADQLLELLQTRGEWCEAEVGAVYFASACDDALLESIIRETARRRVLSVLREVDIDAERFATSRLPIKPDIVLLDEAGCGFELPFGVCAVRRFRERNIWTRQVDELAVRPYGAMAGPPMAVNLHHLLRRFQSAISSHAEGHLHAIAIDQARTNDAHRDYVNPSLVVAFEAFGLAVRLKNGDRRGYEIGRLDGTSARVINLFSASSASIRGNVGAEIARSLLPVHDLSRDYWVDLERRLPEETGFDQVLPAASVSTAVESGLKLGLLAARQGTRLLVLQGNPVYTRVGALASQTASTTDTMVETAVETCAWPNVTTIDPFGVGAAAELGRQLARGDVGFVWIETQRAARWLLPHDVLEVIDRHRTSSKCLLGVDETIVSLGCGRMFHWQGRLRRPDIVAVSWGWTDSQLVTGYVFASDEVANRARERATSAFGALRSQHRCQLTAHATLQFLDRLRTDGIWTTAAATAARFSQALSDLAASCPLIRGVWGEGLLWVMQFDLDGWPRFVRDWFVTFLWAECMRDRENPIVVSWQVHEPACIRLEPRYDLPIDELEAALDTLRRALSKGVNGIVHDVANEAAQRGDVRRADMFRRMLRGREQHDGSTVGSAG